MKTSWILTACVIVSASAFAEDWAGCHIERPEDKGRTDVGYRTVHSDDSGYVFVISKGDN